jgi:hypothetical protein
MVIKAELVSETPEFSRSKPMIAEYVIVGVL